MKNNQYIRQAQYKKGFASVVLIGAVIILVAIGGYFVFKAKQQPAIQQTASLPVVATTADSKVQAAINTELNKPKISTENNLTFINKDYGFQLTFKDSWKGLRVFVYQRSDGEGSPTFFQFSMPTKFAPTMTDDTNALDNVIGYSEIFTITISSKNIWETNNPKNGSKVLGQNGDKIYISHILPSSGLPDDLKNINFDIPQILSTFKFTK